MLARITLIALAISAWLLAAMAGVFAVYCVPYPAVGFAILVVSGLSICYLVASSELELEETSGLSAEVREKSRALGYRPPPSIQTLRFLNQLGLGFMAVGVGGGLYYLFNWVLS